MLMKIVPFMLPIFSFGFPAGLGYYYFVQGLCRIGTQSYITRKFYGDNAEVTATPISASATEKGSESSDKSARATSPKAAPAKERPSTAAAAKSGAERKPGQSARSQAVQKKTATGSTSGRKSGAPRRSGTQKDQRP
jgi:membrane protein insertase Oxa1/YidC/SpoIIIJ